MKSIAKQSPTPPRARAPRLDREGIEQAALISELRARMPKVADLIYHVPNGGHRHKSVAGKLKQQGVVAGIPDLVLTMARGGYFGLYIEFKATPPNDAGVSAEQHERIRKLNEQGYLAIVCRGHFEAVEAIRDYLRLSPTVVVIQ
ncbi:VRR-NUC domain-containing protein [Pseudomonas sp. OV226]|uniref:VRR-NUC domain-containing protein n=1 Tax=Pseudomonas sp. OV226 TaxID=2135588 RepID=UPI000D6D636E|nr:VRR-NUC domain-containing protein [Pseudomonas sp. OV226]PWK30876.1 VRR-NUC domain-containing protein [Pseudomonas sp. OV226]